MNPELESGIPQPSFYRRVQQAIQGEHHYSQCRDEMGQEDEMFYRLGELVEQGLLTADEGQECYTDWILQRRPDTVVIHLGEAAVPKPFYE